MKYQTKRSVIAASMCALFITAAQAQLDPDEKLLEVMKDVQGHQSLVIGRTFGTDPGNTLQFNMSGDVAAGQFSFSSHGQMYKGQPLNINCIGTADPAGDNWTWTSSGSLGAETWQLHGTSNYDFTAARPLSSNSLMNRGAGKPKPDEHSGTVWNGPVSTTWTIHTMDGVEVGNSITFDYRFRLSDGWGWNHTMDSNFIEDEMIGTISSGEWNTSTGQGNFGMEIVPEPASVLGVTLGFVAYLRKRIRRS